MKLIHCADVHLGSRMESNLSGAKAAQRREELLATFADMLTYAAQNEVDAVLLCGDVFDTGRVARATLRYVAELIASVPQVDVLYICGNHDKSDPLSSLETLPDNLIPMGGGGEWHFREYGDVTVAAYCLEDGGEAVAQRLHLLDERFNIVMLHGQLASSVNPEDPTVSISLSDYADRNIDYLALGHIHKAAGGMLDARGQWAYSGCPEGRGFDECGKKGFLLLDTRHPGKIQPVSLARRSLHEVHVELNEEMTRLQIETAVSAAVEGIGEQDMVKVVLTGTSPSDGSKDPEQLGRMLRERFFFAKVQDETRLALHYRDFEGEISLKGAFIRQVLASDLTEEMKEQVMLAGLQALSGEEIEA